MSARAEEYNYVKQFINSIQSVRDKISGEDYSDKTYTIEKITSKASNTKIPVYKFILDGKPISRNNSLVVGYKCLTCSIQQEITLTLFVRKVTNNTRRCAACVNLAPEKRAAHSDFMHSHEAKFAKGEKLPVVAIPKWSELTLSEKLVISLTTWDAKDDEFKRQYYNAHLTEAEFERIRSRIKSIGNGKIRDLTDWKYFPTFRVFNQTQFTPMLVHGDVIDKPQYIEFECESCECTFVNRDLEVQKNSLKILCNECKLSNRVFKIKRYNMSDGSFILYQSTPELKFIEWCIENGIKIENGPHIEYEFEEKMRKYKVDFCLPDLKRLVEIKDNHVWHIRQVQSGKWPAKERCAIEWSEKNGYTYNIVYPKTMSAFKAALVG